MGTCPFRISAHLRQDGRGRTLTEFTHQTGVKRLVRGAKGCFDVWEQVCGGRRVFPARFLVPASETLGELIRRCAWGGDTYELVAELLRRPLHMAVIGCGGTGCAIAVGLPYLHQPMLVAGHPGGLAVTVLDGDTLSPSNTVRQLFCLSKIGLNKAIVTNSRLNLFWRLDWTAAPDHLGERSDIGSFEVVIGCVDTRAARLWISPEAGCPGTRACSGRKVEGTNPSG